MKEKSLVHKGNWGGITTGENILFGSAKLHGWTIGDRFRIQGTTGRRREGVEYWCRLLASTKTSSRSGSLLDTPRAVLLSSDRSLSCAFDRCGTVKRVQSFSKKRKPKQKKKRRKEFHIVTIYIHIELLNIFFFFLLYFAWKLVFRIL